MKEVVISFSFCFGYVLVFPSPYELEPFMYYLCGVTTNRVHFRKSTPTLLVCCTPSNLLDKVLKDLSCSEKPLVAIVLLRTLGLL